MKRLIQRGLMFGNLIEASTAPHPQPLPTRGRGGDDPVGGFDGDGRGVPPSPLWGGLGWGALGIGRDA